MKPGIDYVGIGIGAVVINKNKRILLAKRGKKARNERGKWECPGGGLKFGDGLEETIIREIKEELNIEIEIVDYLEPYNHLIPDDQQHWVAICYVCKIKSGRPKIMEPDKCEAIGWFTIKEMEKMDLSLATKHRLKQIKEKRKMLRLD